VALHPSRRIAEPVIGRAFARPVGDASESLTEKTVNEMKTRGFSVVIARSEATKQSILRRAEVGLLRFARNDGLISLTAFLMQGD
jgi:hypothetical protein